jgi:N,N'-diacetyllegionaminate synthase|tara:strand:+ start:179 stop:868 length:690 start_codon:yes stop_codon:yes gene_type:complete
MVKFIAECGMNHNGNLDLTYELIRQAKWAGADIAKFQLGWRSEKGELNHITDDRLKKMIDYCHYMSIEPMFSIITHEAYDLIKKFNIKIIKVASRTVIDHIDLVKKILDDKNQTIISLGMWDNDELPFKKTDLIDYLWCISKYPCLPDDLKGFPKNFRDSVYSGYSDHTLGIETSLIAISRGAQIIEKHFTLDKSDNTIRDHALSATPEEFRQLVILGTEISKLTDKYI